MENYKIQKRLGDGTYGCVYKATHNKTGDIVAIKKFKRKYTSWDECMQLREIKALHKLKHPNIITLKEVLKDQDELNLVFEYLERNVFEAYMEYKNKGEKISESTIKSIMRQLIEGLAYMHKHGYFHRDLKPENLLMYGETVKICDFGLAREIRSRPPYTDYVATRWYRAPEILLKQTNYNSPVDIFAVGCIMAELYMLSPLFSGQSEIDQLNKICQILGTPNNNNWPEASKLANQARITFPQCQPQSLEYIIPNCSQEGIYVIQQMLLFDPSKRPSAQQILQFPYFTSTPLPPLIQQIQFPKVSKHEERINFGKLGEAQLKETKSNFYDVVDVKKKKDDKFRDSSTNFLDFLDQKLSEQDKQWNAKIDKNKQTGTLEKFNPKPILHHQNSKDNFVEEISEFLQDDTSNKRNNPFKLLKYNDPIGGVGSTSVNHHYDMMPAKQSKPLSMIHANPYPSAQYSLPYCPSQGKSTILPKNEISPLLLQNARMPQQIGQPKIPMYYQSRIHQNYGRIGENLVGGRRNVSNNNKYDEFGFNKPSKQYNY